MENKNIKWVKQNILYTYYYILYIHILYIHKSFPTLLIPYHNFVTIDLNEQEKSLEGNIPKKQKQKTYGKYSY